MKLGSDARPLAHVLAEARARLIAAGIRPTEAALDTDLYACTILRWDRARLVTERQRPVPPQLEPRFSEWIARRAQREPSAYIVGVREFWGLDFVVTPAVLIPRPETEFIVEETLRLLSPPARIADIGTGSGCVAVAIAHECSACADHRVGRLSGRSGRRADQRRSAWRIRPYRVRRNVVPGRRARRIRRHHGESALRARPRSAGVVPGRAP